MNPPTDSHTPEASAYASARYKPLPRVLGVVQHRFMERCRRISELAFLEAEDALQVASIGARNRWALEAMEQLRVNRPAILRSFAKSIGLKFSALGQSSPAKDAVDTIEKFRLDLVDGMSFSSIQNIKVTAARLRGQHQAALNIANKRLDHLVADVEVNETNSPLEPASIVDTFIQFVDSRNLSRQAKEALISHFEWQLERKLGACFDEVNRVLGDARIFTTREALPNTSGETTPLHIKSPPAYGKRQAIGRGQPRADVHPAGHEKAAVTADREIPILEDKVEEAPPRAAKARPKPNAQAGASQRQAVGAEASSSAPIGRDAIEIGPRPERGIVQPRLAPKPDSRQRQSPPNSAVSGRSSAPNREIAKAAVAIKPSAFQCEILDFYRQRPVMSAQDSTFDELSSRPATAYLGENPERDKVMAMCTELFDEIRNDDDLPALVRQKLICLRVVYTAYAVNRNPKFLIQPASPARSLLELLWDLGRALQDSPVLQKDTVFILICDAVESILIPSLAHERDFYREYRKILAHHY